jgi:integrative and conjugative element protein (TIGR02256 family)
MTDAAKSAVPRETGGLLLGYFDNAEVVVQAAVEVIDPDATAISYTRQQVRAQNALDDALKSADDELGYVGDWHSHPGAAFASRQDRRELRRAAAELQLPLAMVVVRVRMGTADIRVYVEQTWCQESATNLPYSHEN